MTVVGNWFGYYTDEVLAGYMYNKISNLIYPENINKNCVDYKEDLKIDY